jgi:succinate-semialdehyde dehydrogenase/glutarate-semialdehyde dehydrogenase
MKFGHKKLYVNGELRDAISGKSREIICPGTEEVVADIAWSGSGDAELALNSARKGFKSWSKLPVNDRKKWMLKLREAVIENEEILREAVMYENGKTWDQTFEDYETVINALEFYPQAMSILPDELLPDPDNSHSHEMVTQPAGVVVAFLAWNFPLLNVGFKLGPALAAGCTIIIKPSSSSPLSAYILGEIMHSIGFPPGVVNILAGPNDEVGDYLTSSKIPSVLTMIGSTYTARHLIGKSTTSIKRMSMELGGNAPFIVFEDANLEKAAEDLKNLKYGNCGQVCVSPNRIFIHEEIYKDFLNIFLEKVQQLKVGFGKKSGINMGPLINRSAVIRMESLLEDAIQKGASLKTGGKQPESITKGYFFEPTILEDITPEMLVFREEIFGPIAAIMSFKNIDELLSLANDTEYGLASYIYTNRSDLIEKFTSELEFGEVQVNGFKYAIYLPHGGIKESGMGHDCSYLALHDYLVKKRITKTL